MRPRDAGGFLHRAVRARLRLCPGLWPAEPERAEEAVSAPEIPPVPESQWTRTEIPVDPQPEKQPDVEAILKDYSSKTE